MTEAGNGHLWACFCTHKMIYNMPGSGDRRKVSSDALAHQLKVLVEEVLCLYPL